MFILSDYQIYIKMMDQLIHFPLGKIEGERYEMWAVFTKFAEEAWT